MFVSITFLFSNRRYLQEEPMISSARLLFSGIGADELMGGYSRYRGAWQNGGGLQGVINEIQLDINRSITPHVQSVIFHFSTLSEPGNVGEDHTESFRGTVNLTEILKSGKFGFLPHSSTNNIKQI